MDNLVIPEQLRPFIPLILNLAYAFTIFIVGWLGSKWARFLSFRVLRKTEVDETLARFLASTTQYVVLAVTVIVALDRVGIETTSLVALLASASLAIGLALQGSLSNFAAGVMILFFRPFTLGERITAAGHTATVDSIGLFATTMLTPDNEKIIVPNSSITGGSIVNLTTRGTLRGNIEVGVAYGTDLRQAMKTMKDACQRADLVLSEPEPSVASVGFGASALGFVVQPWAKSGHYTTMLHNVRLALDEDLKAAGIEIPFDQIVVHRST